MTGPTAVRFGLTPAINALATIMLTITVLAVVVTAMVLRRSRVRAPPVRTRRGPGHCRRAPLTGGQIVGAPGVRAELLTRRRGPGS